MNLQLLKEYQAQTFEQYPGLADILDHFDASQREKFGEEYYVDACDRTTRYLVRHLPGELITAVMFGTFDYLSPIPHCWLIEDSLKVLLDPTFKSQIPAWETPYAAFPSNSSDITEIYDPSSRSIDLSIQLSR